MSTAAAPVQAEGDSIDQAALRLMLSYVEAECLRIGATDAARHAALAASLMPAPPASAGGGLRPRAASAASAGAGRSRSLRMH
jgi:hypothetical protein